MTIDLKIKLSMVIQPPLVIPIAFTIHMSQTYSEQIAADLPKESEKVISVS